MNAIQLQTAAANKIIKAIRAHFFRRKVLVFLEKLRQDYCAESSDSENQISSDSTCYDSIGYCELCRDEGPKGTYCDNCEDSGQIYW